MGCLGLRYLVVAGAILAMSAARSVITLSAMPPNAYGGIFGGGPVLTNEITVTPSGGTGAYTYSWTQISGGTVGVSASTSATTAFTGTLALGETIEAEYKCTVTDSTSATAEISVTVLLFEVS